MLSYQLYCQLRSSRFHWRVLKLSSQTKSSRAWLISAGPSEGSVNHGTGNRSTRVWETRLPCDRGNNTAADIAVQRSRPEFPRFTHYQFKPRVMADRRLGNATTLSAVHACSRFYRHLPPIYHIHAGTHALYRSLFPMRPSWLAWLSPRYPRSGDPLLYREGHIKFLCSECEPCF